MSNNIRVRFAPSPTGLLHLGGMRSALFNWLYAQKTGGQYILRLEDTDRERFVPEAVDQIKASHDWLGLTPDQIVTQSDRLDLYQTQAQLLTEKEALYPCWCSPERLSELRTQAQAEHRAFKYDRHCLNNPQASSDPHVLRFKIPDDPRAVSWADAVRGTLTYKLEDLDDFVAIKSDGYPTYNFANVVDDHDMEISHVLRAEEFLPSTPKHILLYQAFGWAAPTFAHLPQVLGKDGSKKLSKREGAKSVLDYRQEGYLPDAIINFLALLGWNEGEGSTKEVYSRAELIKAFSLERIQKSPAVFDEERLDWMNGLYIRALPLEALLQAAEPYWTVAKGTDSAYRQAILALVQDRLKKLSELDELTDFFFSDPKAPAPAEHQDWLKHSLDVIEHTEFTAAGLETAFRQACEELQAKPKAYFGLLREVLTGRQVSPPLFDTMAVLGKETVQRRLQAVIKS
jgi:glutamyl-tRNA synthetase